MCLRGRVFFLEAEANLKPKRRKERSRDGTIVQPLSELMDFDGRKKRKRKRSVLKP